MSFLLEAVLTLCGLSRHRQWRILYEVSTSRWPIPATQHLLAMRLKPIGVTPPEHPLFTLSRLLLIPVTWRGCKGKEIIHPCRMGGGGINLWGICLVGCMCSFREQVFGVATKRTQPWFLFVLLIILIVWFSIIVSTPYQRLNERKNFSACIFSVTIGTHN